MGVKEQLIKQLYNESFKYSKEPIFKLVSGELSNFYINCKPVTMSSNGLYLIGNLIYNNIHSTNTSHITAVGGLTMGADPIAMAVARASYDRLFNINAFSIRKTKKNHGTSLWIEGCVEPGEHVAIIDDVATTGISTITAIERARNEGLIVDKVIILVDRQEGGIENIKKYVNNVVSIVKKDDLMEIYNTSNNI